eukprot:COSAG05_NODE_98_length_19441_cov_32.923327_10_plen_264_part_00
MRLSPWHHGNTSLCEGFVRAGSALSELPTNETAAGQCQARAVGRKIDVLAQKQRSQNLNSSFSGATASTQPADGHAHSAMAVAARCGFRECDCAAACRGGDAMEVTDDSFFARLHEPAEQAELNKSSTACCGTPNSGHGANHSGLTNISYDSQDLSDAGTMESWRLSSTPSSAERERDRQRAAAEAEAQQACGGAGGGGAQVDGFAGWAMLSPMGIGNIGATPTGDGAVNGGGGDGHGEVDRTPLRTRQGNPFSRLGFRPQDS